MVTTAVFVAAGLGSRLGDKTKEQPKGFLEVGGASLIERSLTLLRKRGINKIIIGTGYLSEFYEELAVKEKDIICLKSPVFKETSSFYTLYNLRSVIQDSFILLESDLIYEERALKELLDDPRENIVLASGATCSEDEVFIYADNEDRIINISKKRDSLKEVSGELVGISKVSLNQYKKLCSAGEEDEQLLMKGDYETAFSRLTESPFIMKKIDNLIWAEIDCEEHLMRVNREILPALEGK